MSEPSVQKVTSYQLFTRDLPQAQASLPLHLDATITQASIDAAQGFVLAGDANLAAIAAQGAAESAAADAAAATAAIADLSSDSLLTPAEKPRVISEKAQIDGEVSGISSTGTSLGRTTQTAAYVAAKGALDTYLATLATPVPWYDRSGNTTIVGADFRQAFLDYYDARQVLLNACAFIADLRAKAAATDAASAISLAGSRTTVFYSPTTPANPTIMGDGSEYWLTTGDLWYDTSPDSDGRISYRPWKYSQTTSTWTRVTAPSLIVASEIAAGAITADKIAAGQLKTSNYAEDGSGNPTAGAKLDHAGTALKVAPGNLRLGETLLSDAWFANMRVIPFTFGHTVSGWYFNQPATMDGTIAVTTNDIAITLTVPGADASAVPWIVAQSLTIPTFSLVLSYSNYDSGTGKTKLDFIIYNSSGTQVSTSSIGTFGWTVFVMFTSLSSVKFGMH